MLGVETLKCWSERLCRMSSGGRADAAKLLDVSSAVVEHGDYVLVEPPPSGTTRLRIFDDLATHQVVDYIDIELEPDAITLPALEAVLGAGEPSVRVSATSPHKQRYRVEVSDAPCTCDVYATFSEEPTIASSAISIMLRRNPSPAPKR